MKKMRTNKALNNRSIVMSTYYVKCKLRVIVNYMKHILDTQTRLGQGTRLKTAQIYVPKISITL